MKINSFSGPYEYLSNFYDAPVFFEGLHYKNSEAAYQAGKASNPLVRRLFTGLSPGKAKRLGRSMPIREDWDAVKADYMRRVVHAKFTQNPLLAQALIQTGDAEIEEGNVWHDNYFGNCGCPACRKTEGLNILGRILMEERERLVQNA